MPGDRGTQMAPSAALKFAAKKGRRSGGIRIGLIECAPRVPRMSEIPQWVLARLQTWHDTGAAAFGAMRSIRTAVSGYMDAQRRSRFAATAPRDKRGAGQRRETPKAVARAVAALERASQTLLDLGYLNPFWRNELVTCLERVRAAPFPASVPDLQSAMGVLVAASKSDDEFLSDALHIATHTNVTWAEAWGGRRMFSLEIYPTPALAKCAGVSAQTLYRAQRLWSRKSP